MVVGTGERAIRLARGARKQSAEYGVRLRGFLSEQSEGRAR